VKILRKRSSKHFRLKDTSYLTFCSYIIGQLPEGGEGGYGYDDGEGDD
jgi:hypothetical protein